MEIAIITCRGAKGLPRSVHDLRAELSTLGVSRDAVAVVLRDLERRLLAAVQEVRAVLLGVTCVQALRAMSEPSVLVGFADVYGGEALRVESRLSTMEGFGP